MTKTTRLNLDVSLLGAGPVMRKQVQDNFKKLDAAVPLQGAAVANATDNASAITQLNALLASLRASGAIAAS